jgi:hypothetical protein
MNCRGTYTLKINNNNKRIKTLRIQILQTSQPASQHGTGSTATGAVERVLFALDLLPGDGVDGDEGLVHAHQLSGTGVHHYLVGHAVGVAVRHVARGVQQIAAVGVEVGLAAAVLLGHGDGNPLAL